MLLAIHPVLHAEPHLSQINLSLPILPDHVRFEPTVALPHGDHHCGHVGDIASHHAVYPMHSPQGGLGSQSQGEVHAQYLNTMVLQRRLQHCH